MSEEERDDVVPAVGDAEAVELHPDALGRRRRHQVLHRDPLALIPVRACEEREVSFVNHFSLFKSGTFVVVTAT